MLLPQADMVVSGRDLIQTSNNSRPDTFLPTKRHTMASHGETPSTSIAA